MYFKHIKCNICGADSTKLVGERMCESGSRTNIVQCLSCGLMYPNPMPFLDLKETQDNFNSVEEYFPSPVTDKRIKKCEKIIKIIEKFKPKKGNLLDVGCGRGELAYAFNKHGWKVTGTEISEAFTKYAEQKFHINVLVGEINDLKLPGNEYDAILLSSVIQYVKDPLSTLKKINFVLKRDGILYIEVTNENALIFKVSDFCKSIRNGKNITTHLSPTFPSFQIYGFNKKALKKILTKAGFNISYLKVKGIFGGGNVKGDGVTNLLVNTIRKIVIFIGGLLGMGHLLYCVAKKKEK